MLRATVHLVTVRDCLRLYPVLQPVIKRQYNTSPFGGRNLVGMDIAPVVEAGRALVEERPRTLAELRKLLGEQWPDRDANALAYTIHYQLPIVQVPPRGVWGVGGQATLTTADHWLGRPMETATQPDEMIIRYLGAFGPANARDMQTWSGLTRLSEVVDRLRPRLRTFRDESGREIFDLPDAPRPDPDTPAPPRFLPEYDNVFLSHSDRSRIVDDDYRKRMATRNGVLPNTILVDGFVRATWRIVHQGDVATLIVMPFEPLTNQERTSVAEEGMQLLAFAAAESKSHDVQFGALRDA